jgi:hypothetical protein
MPAAPINVRFRGCRLNRSWRGQPISVANDPTQTQRPSRRAEPQTTMSFRDSLTDAPDWREDERFHARFASNGTHIPSLDFFFRGTSDTGHPQPFRWRLCARSCDTRAGTKASQRGFIHRESSERQGLQAIAFSKRCERMSKESENQA